MVYCTGIVLISNDLQNTRQNFDFFTSKLLYLYNKLPKGEAIEIYVPFSKIC